MSVITGKLTKRLVENLPAGRHSDGNGLFLVVDPSGARRWVVRVTVKGAVNKQGGPLRTDFGLGGASTVSLQLARARALEYRKLAHAGLNPRFHNARDIPTFEQVATQTHQDRLPTWKNPKHAQQWINTLRDYAFPVIGHLPVDKIGSAEILKCLLPIWVSKHETAKRLSQRLKIVLDVARAKGYRSGENPVTVLHTTDALPKVKARVTHHSAMPWRDVPLFFAQLGKRDAMAARALQFTILTACRTNEVLGMKWTEVDFDAGVWTVSAGRMKTGVPHRVPLTDAMRAILRPLEAVQSDFVFEGARRNQPLSNMSLLMLLRRIGAADYTVHGFRSAFRDWVSEATTFPRELAEMQLSHTVGSEVERAYSRSDLLDRRRELVEAWGNFVLGEIHD